MTVVTSLVVFSFRRSTVAILGNVTLQATVVTFDTRSLTVSGKMVNTTTLVTSSGTSRSTAVRSRWTGTSNWSWSGTVLGNMANLVTFVTSHTVVWTFTFDVTGFTTNVTGLFSSSVRSITFAGVVTWFMTVVTQSFGLWTVIGNMTGITTFVTSFNKDHF